MSNAPTLPSTPVYVPLAAGTLVNAMCGGHVVKAKILRYLGEKGQHVGHDYEMEFLSHHSSGATALCLDGGSNSWIHAGGKFAAGTVQIERAAYWLAQK